MGRLTGKVAIVTGGAQGQGAAISRAFVAEGAKVAIADVADEPGKALADELGATFAEFEGVARGNPAIRAGAAITINGMGEPFDGKYTVTTSRHRFDPTTGYTTSLSVSGKHDRSLLGLASGGARSSRTQAGVVIGVEEAV